MKMLISGTFQLDISTVNGKGLVTYCPSGASMLEEHFGRISDFYSWHSYSYVPFIVLHSLLLSLWAHKTIF